MASMTQRSSFTQHEHNMNTRNYMWLQTRNSPWQLQLLWRFKRPFDNSYIIRDNQEMPSVWCMQRTVRWLEQVLRTITICFLFFWLPVLGFYIYCFFLPDSCQIHSKSILIFIWCWNNNRPPSLLSLIKFFSVWYCLDVARGWCC